MSMDQDQSSEKSSAATPRYAADQTIAEHRDLLMERFPLPARVSRRPRNRRMALVALTLAAIVVWWSDPAYRTEHLTTAIGQHTEVELADGSHIHLNTDTQLDLSWHLRSRRVQLQRGQALFNVEHTVYRPFMVDANDTRVTVLGTMFEVWRKPDLVQVTVLRGRVKVQTRNEAIYLSENQQTHATLQHIAAPVTVDAAMKTAWKDGKLIFDRTPLKDALQEMQRYTRTNIAAVDDALGNIPVSGVFDTARAENMLDLLPAILPVSVTRDGSDIVRIRAR
jgi:transmembrane sensor